MENLANVAKILDKAGYTLKNCQSGFLCIQDPTCIWPPLISFISVAWVILAVITAFLLAGWGITMLRGANHNMVKNLRTLVLIFGTLSVALPAVNVLGAGKAIVNQCDTIMVSAEEIDALVQMKSQTLQDAGYENFEIIDSQFDDMEFNF